MGVRTRRSDNPSKTTKN